MSDSFTTEKVLTPNKLGDGDVYLQIKDAIHTGRTMYSVPTPMIEDLVRLANLGAEFESLVKTTTRQSELDTALDRLCGKIQSQK